MKEFVKKRNNPKVKNPARYRLDFIKENTFNRVWSVRMTRARVALVSATVIAGGAALIWCVMAYTPMRNLLPGSLRGDLRAQYVEAALRLDSLENAARMNEAYLNNLLTIMRDQVEGQNVAAPGEIVPESAVDSLLAASEAEKAFVRSYEDEERFNLSVLAPIAAEGMVFTSPNPTAGIAASPYRGTVLAVTTDANGLTDLIIQHPNDFVSVFEGLRDVYVEKGRKLVAGQRVGAATSSSQFSFSLWHNGSVLNPEDYISF